MINLISKIWIKQEDLLIMKSVEKAAKTSVPGTKRRMR